MARLNLCGRCYSPPAGLLLLIRFDSMKAVFIPRAGSSRHHEIERPRRSSHPAVTAGDEVLVGGGERRRRAYAVIRRRAATGGERAEEKGERQRRVGRLQFRPPPPWPS